MREIQLEELKKIETEILNVFDSFCNENGLSYSLAGGTLLGAVRHKGFIPWDDDIDLIMPRNDYEKLIRLREQFPKPYLIRSIETEKEKSSAFLYSYMKIVDIRTKMIEISEFLDYPTNIYIDVFPTDGLPENPNEISKIYKKAKKMYTFGYFMNLNGMKIKKEKMSFSGKVWNGMWAIFNRILPTNYGFAKLNELAKSFSVENSQKIGVIVAGSGLKEVMPKSAFFPMKKIEFEGRMYSSMNEPELYLSNLYGDFMKLPPESERIKRHENKAWWIEGEI